MAFDPVLIAYTAKRTGPGKTAWTRIGCAYPHEAGAGLTVKLDSMPLDGIVILLELDDRDQLRLGEEAARPAVTAGCLTASLTFEDIRAARALLRDRERLRLTGGERTALKAVLDCHDTNTAAGSTELDVTQQLLDRFRRKP